MSIIALTIASVGGILNPVSDAGELSVGKGVKSPVVMQGFVGAPDEKDENGEYQPSATFGRLTVRAAIAESSAGKRYVLAIDGGLRGVLFPAPNKASDSSPDYIGNIELPDGANVLPLFGRKMKGKNGEFISLSSKTAEPKKNGRNGHSQSAPEPSIEDDSNIPF